MKDRKIEKILNLEDQVNILIEELERKASINGNNIDLSMAINEEYAVVLFSQNGNNPEGFVVDPDGGVTNITASGAERKIKDHLQNI